MLPLRGTCQQTCNYHLSTNLFWTTLNHTPESHLWAQVEVLKLSWRCPWECWPAIPALRELHLTGRGPGGQFDFTTLDLESALACRGLEAIAIHSDNIFLRTRARLTTDSYRVP